ncbi:MAG: alpha-ketoacid dehydrogenase subunit beta [Candidatus Caldarchaeum sp.]|nr:alpha-ketoacid dehydrogenase subunit beta [Candidatus Caldarchaeum sp.]MCS7133743.1 alpha-ketoacid dehydrogenase subunit beta [Candidatus Caldarchaeum sp.]
MRELTYVEALNEALKEEMRRDGSVVVFGEEVALSGGVYKVTKDLLKEFGPSRVMDTPISEIAIVGAAIGAALNGLRPVAEIMFFDFAGIAFDQIVTHASKIRFTSGGQLKLPLVIRTQYSLGRSYGSQHTQFFAASFLQAPGLKIVLPSTPYDAKGLLKSAIRDDDPVLFIESGALYVNKNYYGYKGAVPQEEYLIPLGKADVKRRGDDVTVVAVSRTVSEAIAASKTLEQEGINAEVVDLRTIQPMDYETVVQSVRKTNRLVIAEDSVKTGGISAEVAAYVAEYALDALEGPIIRVNSPPMPAPQSQPLEKQYMVSAEKIVDAVKKLVK